MQRVLLQARRGLQREGLAFRARALCRESHVAVPVAVVS